MRYLLLSRDERLTAAMEAAAPPGDRLLVAVDVAAAARRWPGAVYGGVCLDGGLARAAVMEAARAWRSGALEAGLLVVVEPWEAAPPPEAVVVERDAELVWQRLAPAGMLTLDVGRACVSDGRAEMRLTPSELIIVLHVADAREGVEARALSAALGYAWGESSVVRTHLTNIRRKGRAAGLGDVVERSGRRYFSPRVRVMR